MTLSPARAIEAYRAALPPGQLLEFALTPLDRLGIPVQALTLFPSSAGTAPLLSWPLCEGIGYGETPAAARVGAYGELTEEVSSSAALLRLPRQTGSYREMVAQPGGRGVVDPVTLCLEAGSPYTPDTVLEWTEARRWSTDEPVLLPAEFVACAGMDVPPRPGVRRLVTPITNGHGAGSTPEMAQVPRLCSNSCNATATAFNYRALADTTRPSTRATVTDPACRGNCWRSTRRPASRSSSRSPRRTSAWSNLYVVGYDRAESGGARCR